VTDVKAIGHHCAYQLTLSVSLVDVEVAVVVGSVVATARRSEPSRRRQEAKGKEEVGGVVGAWRTRPAR
jgi:hypothetical protein